SGKPHDPDAGQAPERPPLHPAERHRHPPLSFAQERLWFLDRLQPGLTAYIMAETLEVSGALDPEALRRSMADVASRHEILRTTYREEDGEPVQIVHPAATHDLPVVDLSALPAREREAEAHRAASAAADEPIDLATDAPLRGRLLRLTPESAVLVVQLHHIAGDGWSVPIVIRELCTHYAARTDRGSARPPGLPELPIQYADFAVWQRRWLRGEVLERDLAYWRETLAGAPAALELPTDRPRPARRRHRGGEVVLPAARGLGASLHRIQQETRTTPFGVALAAFGALLSRICGQTDLVIGSPVAGRTHVDLEPLIGLFANTVALRVDCSGDPSFSELVARAREVVFGASEHQHLPFERLVEEIEPRRDLSRSPVFQVMLLLDDDSESYPELPGARLGRFPLDRTSTLFDLTLVLRGTGDRVQATLELDRDLFDEATAGRLLRHLAVLLDAASAHPEIRLGELPLLDPAERHQILREWHGTPAGDPRARTLAERLLANDAVEERIALIRDDVHWSYGELRRRSARIAAHLRSLGIGPETVVGVLLPRSPELVAALLGVLGAGAAYLPLDPEYPEARLALMLDDAHAPVLLADELWKDRVPAGTRIVPPAAARPGPTGEDPEWPRPAAAGSNLAYVIYTSGSTGRPKGVAIEHRSSVALIEWALRAFSERELSSVAAATSVCFDLSIFELFVPLAAGGTVVLVDDALSLDPARSPAAERVRLVNTVPSVLGSLLDAGRMPSGVTTVNLAGEPLWADLVARLREDTGVSRLFNLYGPSEDTTYSTWASVDLDGHRPPTIGRPVDGTSAHVLGPGQRPLPIGVAGDLHLTGPGLARGYLGRPALTAERFVPDAHSGLPGNRLYRTGDLVRRLPNGELDFLGRIDHQVKLRGFRIELGEIEHHLRRAPEVAEAVAIVHQPRSADPRLVAYACPAAGEHLDPDALRRHLSDRLPAYMVPQRFVLLPELPRKPNGKLDRSALPAPEPRPEEDRAGVPGSRDEMEELVAGLFSEVLGLEPPSPSGSFFELGGHSLLATRLVARLSRALGMELPLTLLFERPTVAELAGEAGRLLQEDAGSPPAPIHPAERQGVLPASFAQQRLWLAEQMNPGSPIYSMPFALRFEGMLDPEALRRALGGVVERHEALRTVFEDVDGVPAQVVLERLPVRMPTVDLGGIPRERRGAEARWLVERAARRPFDLARGPLLRTVLVRLDARDHLLGLFVHHIVFDGWSVSLFVREAGTLYRAFRTGAQAALPRLPIQYPDYAVWQRRRLEGPELDRLLAYWRQRLSPLPEPLELPADRPGRTDGSPPAGVHSWSIGPELTRKLEAASRREGATLFMTLMAGLKALLAKVCGSTDVAVGADHANRDRLETESLIGFFVNILVLRTDLGGDPTFRQILERVRRGTLGAYAHRELPLEKLVEVLRPQRRADATPLFQVLFIMQNVPEATLELPGLRVEAESIDTGIARFDLALFVARRDGALDLRWDFRSDRFDPGTVAEFADALKELLTRIADAPETRLSALDIVHPNQKRRHAMETKPREATSLKDFKKFRKPKATPVTVTSEVVRSRPLNEERKLPLLVEPSQEDVDLAEWASDHRERIEGWLAEHGGILFRGFDVDGVQEFERVAEGICPDLYDEYGDLPQEKAGEKIYTSTPYPHDKTILFHNESSHLQSWPMRQFFYCSIPSAEGGETPLVDCRELYRSLPEDLVERFARDGLLYIRNFVPALDVSWQDFFRTDDPAEVEAHCRRVGIELEWREDGGLRTRRRAPAVAVHPGTGERVFFNQIPLHHPSCLDPETRSSLESLLGEDELPRDVRYGDGTRIDDATVQQI
ncbi:MAG: amino acid adenylation domain-containing protein, partial [Acidobacteriota bacterium]